MSKLARALGVAAMLAAMHLAAITAVAQAHATDRPSKQADATVRRLLARERSSIPNAAHPRLLLDEDRTTLLNLPNETPAQPASPTPPAQPGDRTGWIVPALAGLVALLALVAGVAVATARRATRPHRADQTA
jgi:hypothetical protein